MADLNKIVDELSELTVLEAAELSKLLEEKWGVSAAAAARVSVPSSTMPTNTRSARRFTVTLRATRQAQRVSSTFPMG